MKKEPVRVREPVDEPLGLYPGDWLMTERLLNKIQNMQSQGKEAPQSEREKDSKGVGLCSLRWKSANMNH